MKTPTKLVLLLIGCLLLAVVGLLFLQRGDLSPTPDRQKLPEQQPQKAKTSVVTGNTGKSPASVAKKQIDASAKKGASKSVRPIRANAPSTPKVRPVVTPETALKQWEDRLALYTDENAKERATTTPVTAEEQQEMYELFNALSPEAKFENINHAVNLLPDETFPVIFDILFDKGQPAEVITTLFHDLLNRDETLKNPVLEELAKDKSHPMYVEAARILDVVKE